MACWLRSDGLWLAPLQGRTNPDGPDDGWKGTQVTYSTILSTDELAAIAEAPDTAVVDCRFTLDDPDWGAREYQAAHIPGAVYTSLDRDLSGSKTGRNGRHPLPDPTVLAQTLSRCGIGVHTQVVAYDQDAGAFAARLWWLLRWLGHERVAVLDGGFARWTRESRPTRTGVEVRPPRPFAGTPRTDWIASAADVARMGPAERHGLIDARAPERYRGDVEPIDRVGGHIPGASNYHYLWNVDARNQFRPPEWISARVKHELGDIDPQQAVCYCGSGVTACHLVLALETAGLPGVKLYPGSWSEWSSDPERPVERGSGPPKDAGVPPR
jgi:thiosulfate/3-mercaptopyruvate sulfurtransferase